ncbi:MAG: putative baseplate assembly protein, partial [Pirellulales bacterium]
FQTTPQWPNGEVIFRPFPSRAAEIAELSQKLEQLRARMAGIRGTTRVDEEQAEQFEGFDLANLVGSVGLPGELQRTTRDVFGPESDVRMQLLQKLRPEVAPVLYDARRRVRVEPENTRVYVLRTKAKLFGATAPVQYLKYRMDGNVPALQSTDDLTTVPDNETDSQLFLDGVHEGVGPDSYIIIRKPGRQSTATDLSDDEIHTVRHATVHPRTAYGVSQMTTEIVLERAWRKGDGDLSPLLRGTLVYAESEELELAEAPIDTEIPETPSRKSEVEADGLLDGWETGRFLVVTGERADVAGVAGLRAAELVQLLGVREVLAQESPSSAPATAPLKRISRILFTNDLKHTYKRDTVVIHGNVVEATHGATQAEVLGSGDARLQFQRFTISKPRITHLSAPTALGAEQQLEVRVNDVEWTRADDAADLGDDDRSYVAATDNSERTAVMFGDGRHGARLPTGVENVRAVYRAGGGKAGNVGLDRITQLADRPLGVKSARNPLRASGGADPESRDDARQTTPLGVMSLDRLVSVQDYEDFTRNFAGIAKASATRIHVDGRDVVHVTIAGADDGPIDAQSQLYRNLLEALKAAGDPSSAVQLDTRQLILLVAQVSVRIDERYEWETVEPRIRSAVLDRFSFARSGLGQDVLLSELIRVVQAVPGVVYVDIDVFDGVTDADVIATTNADSELLTRLAAEQPLARIRAQLARVEAAVKPAQLAYFAPEIPDTLILLEASP